MFWPFKARKYRVYEENKSYDLLYKILDNYKEPIYTIEYGPNTKKILEHIQKAHDLLKEHEGYTANITFNFTCSDPKKCYNNICNAIKEIKLALECFEK